MWAPAALLVLLAPGVAHADGMGYAGLAFIILAGASFLACALYLLLAAAAGVTFLVMRGKPKHVARRVVAILSLVLAVPGALIALVMLAQEIASVIQRPNDDLFLAWFLAPPLACAGLLGLAGVLLLRADRAAPPAPPAPPTF